MYYSSKSSPSDLSFSINDVQFPIVDHLDLLGITIDNSLNFLANTLPRLLRKLESS